MIRASLFGTVLAVAAVTGPFDDSAVTPTLTAAQKMAATAPLIRSATDCITRAVVANPHYSADTAVAMKSFG